MKPIAALALILAAVGASSHAQQQAPTPVQMTARVSNERFRIPNAFTLSCSLRLELTSGVSKFTGERSVIAIDFTNRNWSGTAQPVLEVQMSGAMFDDKPSPLEVFWLALDGGPPMIYAGQLQNPTSYLFILFNRVLSDQDKMLDELAPRANSIVSFGFGTVDGDRPVLGPAVGTALVYFKTTAERAKHKSCTAAMLKERWR